MCLIFLTQGCQNYCLETAECDAIQIATDNTCKIGVDSTFGPSDDNLSILDSCAQIQCGRDETEVVWRKVLKCATGQ